MTKEVQKMNDTIVAVKSVNEGMINMPGLQYMPTSFLPVPKIKLIQPGSGSALLTDGRSEARKGSFYYDNKRVAEDQVKCCILVAKELSFTGPSLNDPSVEETRHSIGLVLLDTTFSKPYTMLVGRGSYQAWRNFTGQVYNLFEMGLMTALCDHEVIITSEEIKDGARTYYRLNFKLPDTELDEVTKDTARQLYRQYETYFDRADEDTTVE